MINENNMHAWSMDEINAMFDIGNTAANAMSNAFQQTTNTMNAMSGMGSEPRRSDAFYRSNNQGYQQMPQYGNGFYQQMPQVQQPQSYGFGYTDSNQYGGMFGGNMFGQTMPQSQNPNTGYPGFWNPAYGK